MVMRRLQARRALFTSLCKIAAAIVLLSLAGRLLAQKHTGDSVTAASPHTSPFHPLGPLASLDGPQSSARPPVPGLSSFSWLDGRWQGNWGPRAVEQSWMAPRNGAMVGVFRASGNGKLLVIELFSLVETPGGIEYRSRHFTTSLAPWEDSGPTVLQLATADATRIVFENALDGKPKRVVFTRTSPDTYVSRSEILSEQGESQVTEITYHRQTPSAGSAGRR
jgi:hypothetical protein